MNSTRILYSGYDAPLAFVTTYEDRQYLFFRDFDDELDDYPNEYEVFILPNLSKKEIKESWSLLHEKTVAFICKISVDRVMFDPTRRDSINVGTFKRLVNPTQRS